MTRIKVDEFQKRLITISIYKNRQFGRIYKLFQAEAGHEKECMQFKGHLKLSDAFKNFALETIEYFNIYYKSKDPSEFSEEFYIFAMTIINNIKSLWGAERLAHRGYPFQSCTLLRNIFDSLILASGGAQGLATFLEIEGVKAATKYDPMASKKLRKATERNLRKIMTGADSGLSSETISELNKLDDLFDFEVHGGRLSRNDKNEWPLGSSSLSILPMYKETPFVVFMNRYSESCWMAHRLLPLLQYQNIYFDDEWKNKWKILDESFITIVKALTTQANKKIGIAFVEFMASKFPFKQDSYYS